MVISVRRDLTELEQLKAERLELLEDAELPRRASDGNGAFVGGCTDAGPRSAAVTDERIS